MSKSAQKTTRTTRTNTPRNLGERVGIIETIIESILSHYATKEDLVRIESILSHYATKEDLARLEGKMMELRVILKAIFAVILVLTTGVITLVVRSFIG